MKEKGTVIPINQDEIQLYLKDIRKIRVMTPDRERELSEMIAKGSLSDKEILRIEKELVEGNLRFKRILLILKINIFFLFFIRY